MSHRSPIGPQPGPDYLFSDPEINGIVVILDDIKGRAVAQPDNFGTDAWPA